MVLQSGTSAIDPDGNIIGEIDIGAQVDAIVDIAKETMGEAGVALQDVPDPHLCDRFNQAEDVMRAGRHFCVIRRRRRWSKSADWRAQRS